MRAREWRGGGSRGHDRTAWPARSWRCAVVIASLALLVTTGCTSRSTSSSAGTPGSSISTTAAASPAIAVATLPGKILFARAGPGYGEETIFTADVDGSHQRRVSGFGSSCCPRWSPDGTHILLAAMAPDGKQVTTGIVDANGGHERTIPLPDKTLNLGPGAWSPDGTQIAFQGWDDTNPARSGIYLARTADGSQLVRLTTNTEGGNDLPGDFSPDGRRLVVFRERPNQQSVGRLFVVDLNGTGLHPITPAGMAVGFGTVRWSPDGTRILLQDAANQAHGYLWTVHPDGSGLTRVFADTQGRYALSPTWSPDGRYIMFALDPTADEDSHSPNGLYVIRSDGTGLTLALGGSDFKREPDWVGD
jgi:Tol biopolymer transport system component